MAALYGLAAKCILILLTIMAQQLLHTHKFVNNVPQVEGILRIYIPAMRANLARPEHTVAPMMLIPVAKTVQQEHTRIKQHWLRVKHVLRALSFPVQVQVRLPALLVPQARTTTIHLAHLVQPGGTPIKWDNDLGARVAPWVIPPRGQI